MLIPFGLKGDRLVDVSEVERGRACNCICPSCKQRLRANKGDPLKKIHHFSHDKTPQQKQNNKKECEYSFFVAARLLIKQRLVEIGRTPIMLPDGFVTIKEADILNKTHIKNVKFTQENQVVIDNIQMEKVWSKTEIDISGCINQYYIGFHFSYDGRPPLIYDEDYGNNKALIEIDLTELLYLYETEKLCNGKAFKDVVLDYVLYNSDRKWVYHPRKNTIQKKAQSHIKKYIDTYNRWLFRDTSEKNSLYDAYFGQGGLYCNNCQRVWLEVIGHPSNCPECHKKGEPFGPRAQIHSIKDLDTLEQKNICLKCLSSYADASDGLCSNCYEQFQNKGIITTKKINQEILKGLNIY